jgi:hypothetical protein
MFKSQGHRKLWLAAAMAGLFMVVGCSNQPTNRAGATPAAKKAAPAKPAAAKARTATPAAKETTTEAQTEETAKESKTDANIHETTGTISSITGTRLVLSHKVLKVKAKETTFVLNPKTKKEGHLQIGAKVTVSYRVEKNKKIATRVKAHEAKPAA